MEDINNIEEFFSAPSVLVEAFAAALTNESWGKIIHAIARNRPGPQFMDDLTASLGEALFRIGSASDKLTANIVASFISHGA